MQTIIVIIIVAVTLLGTLRYFYRRMRGQSDCDSCTAPDSSCHRESLTSGCDHCALDACKLRELKQKVAQKEQEKKKKQD